VAISDNDLDACFSTDDFAVPATFEVNTAPGVPTGVAVELSGPNLLHVTWNAATDGNALEVNGHFTEGSDATVMYGVEIEAVEPSFTCRTSEIQDVRNKMSVSVGGNDYTVARIQKIGTGSLGRLFENCK
jgi:hypothetical protein